jgi:hypothetical protein
MIKDLTIAKEALSRIPGYDNEKLSERLTALVDSYILELEQIQKDKDSLTIQATEPNLEDKIPF